MAINALILDFDGTIIDTESPAYESTETIWARHGIDFPWIAASGMGTDRSKSTWVKELENRLGRAIDHDQIMEERQRIKNEMTLSQPVLPGVVKLLDAADRRNIKLAVGSSSPHLADQHLKRVGLYERFSHVVCRDDVGGVSKPAPDVFLRALELLDVSAGSAAVIEDSPNGLKAALAAGIRTIVVPNPLVKSLDFSGAFAKYEGLDDLDPEQLLDLVFAAESA